MARPRKKGKLDWFKMETQWDEKMEALLDECGAVGGFVMQTLWMHLYRTEEGRMDFSSPLVQKSIAKKARCTVEELLSVIEVATQVNLFDRERWAENYELVSHGVSKRLEENEESREVERFRKTPENSGIRRNTQEKTENGVFRNSSPLLSSSLISSDLKEGGVGETDPPCEEEPVPVAAKGLDRVEYRPRVWLCPAEHGRLERELGAPELAYWLDRLEDFAAKNPEKWAREYKDHNRVMRSWRNKKLEDGYEWNPETRRIEKKLTSIKSFQDQKREREAELARKLESGELKIGVKNYDRI